MHHILLMISRGKKSFFIFRILLVIGFLALIPKGGGVNKGIFIKSSQEDISRQDWQVITDIFHARHIAILDSVMQLYRRSYRFNGAVMLAEKGRMIYNKTFGYADIGKKELLTTTHSFQLASVSKQFTAASVMLLAEQGKLNINDKVILFFPEFPYPEVTIEHLLHHTGGLPNYMWMYENRWDSATLIPDNDTLMEMLAANRLGRYFLAGRKHDYSNTGYAVLACIVEQVSGQKFAQFLHDNIFMPLEMTHTFAYAYSAEPPPREIIPGYYRRGRRFYRVEPTLHDGILGDKGIYSNGEDMFKWDQSLYHATLISDSMLNQAFSPFRLRGKREIPYGYGFRIKKDTDDKTVIFHNGLWEGFRLNYYRYVEDQRSVFVMDHTNLTVTGVIARRLKTLMERTEDYHETQQLVEITVEKGAKAALNFYYTLIAEQPELIINTNKIIDVAIYFSQKGKFHPANELKTVYDFFQSEYAYKKSSGFCPTTG
ncbi:MAG: serine hydrolase domain-containing protein [Bacteroidales bacterium]|nr:serine hydrolase [Bacteroidales bacterium]